ncbi:MAG: SDR family oxidoreductase [Candidatus Thorarchaeota archaeon]|nr:SDR family oxidoreductase [Candidatus Thorarchaeota archaeon]
MDTGLSGQHAIVTGAAGGIGLETVLHLLREGARVTAAYHTSAGSLTEIAREWRDSINPHSVDVTSEESVKHLFDQAVARLGRIDILVANAGIANPQPVGVHEMTLAQWQRTMSVNLTGVFLCAKYFLANLRDHPAENASLVMIGSTAGVFGEAWFSDYATSKAALHGLMMSLKNEIVHLARHGRVNIVNPGWTATPMASDVLREKGLVTRILQTIPLRKTATPADIAAAVVYLASDKLAGHVSGQAITVAGGMEGRVLFTPSETLVE